MKKLVIILLMSVYFISTSQDIKYTICEFNNDQMLDTIFVSNFFGNFMPTKIVWGKAEQVGSQKKDEITYLDYVDFKSGSFTIYDFNHDSLLDIFIHYIRKYKKTQKSQ